MVLYTVVKLSPKEAQVAKLRDKGWLHREIAEQLGISTRTVELHWLRVRRKRGVKSQPRRSRFVYILKASNGLIKIGIASDVQSRFRSISTASPLQVRLVAFKEMDDPLEYEQAVLSMFAAQRTRGEWLKPNQKLRDLILRDFTKNT